MSKRILSSQPKFDKDLQSYLLATSNLPHFSTKKQSVIILKVRCRSNTSWELRVASPEFKSEIAICGKKYELEH